MAAHQKADLCIIGARSAGFSIAAGAARLGVKVILIERDRMGGECLNTGCVPSKALGEPEHIAKATVWLAADVSDYVTGTTLFVDGGMALYPAFREGG